MLNADNAECRLCHSPRLEFASAFMMMPGPLFLEVCADRCARVEQLPRQPSADIVDGTKPPTEHDDVAGECKRAILDVVWWSHAKGIAFSAPPPMLNVPQSRCAGAQNPHWDWRRYMAKSATAAFRILYS